MKESMPVERWLINHKIYLCLFFYIFNNIRFMHIHNDNFVLSINKVDLRSAKTISYQA